MLPRLRTPAAIAVLLVAGPVFAPQPSAGLGAPGAPAERLIVAFETTPDEQAHDEAGTDVVRSLRGTAGRVQVVETDDAEAALESYAGNPDVAYAERDGVVRAFAAPADNNYDLQWNLQPSGPGNPASLNWEPVHPAHQSSPSVVVAVVDTGVRSAGTCLADKPLNLRPELGFDFVNRDADASDDNGHGTHVAGTIAQRTGNRETLPPAPPCDQAKPPQSVAGVAPNATVIPVKVLDAEGAGSVSATVEGIRYARDRGAKVINLSLGGEYSKALCDAVAEVSGQALVVAASGNESTGGLTPVAYPAACPGAVAVGALRYDGSRAPYSNVGCQLAYGAPGGDLERATRLFARDGDARNGIVQEAWFPPENRFGFFYDAGTSMAAAHVAGAAAVLLALNPDVGTVKRVLEATARDLGPAGPEAAYGAGAVDLAAAVSALTSGAVPAPREAVGYWMVASDGGMFSFGAAPFHGSAAGTPPASPVVGIARHPAGSGYWMATAAGDVFAFGDASFHGSLTGRSLTRPIVGIAAWPTGDGYWLVASDGGIFAFGARSNTFFGSTGNIVLNRPIVGMASTHSGRGYWLVASDGGLFAFGDAGFHGSTGDIRLNSPIVTMAATPTGAGYWLVASDGGLFAFGDAGFHGSTGDIRLNRPIVGMTPTCYGRGYWLVASDGGIFAFGQAPFLGSTGDITLNRPIVAMALATDQRAADV